MGSLYYTCLFFLDSHSLQVRPVIPCRELRSRGWLFGVFPSRHRLLADMSAALEVPNALHGYQIPVRLEGRLSFHILVVHIILGAWRSLWRPATGEKQRPHVHRRLSRYFTQTHVFEGGATIYGMLGGLQTFDNNSGTLSDQFQFTLLEKACGGVDVFLFPFKEKGSEHGTTTCACTCVASPSSPHSTCVHDLVQGAFRDE